MRARNVLFTLTVGALAFTVAAYAAPRDRATEGKGQVRSESSRLLTGDQASLRDAVDGSVATGGNPYAAMRPVPAQGTYTYPAGTTIAGTGITIPGGPTHVFVEGRFGGWGTQPDPTLKTTQLTLDSAGFSSGSGCPIGNARTLSPQACANNAACDTAYGPGDSATQCSAGNCEDSWQQSSRPDYCLAGQPTISSCSLATEDRTCGMTTLGGCNADAGECYNNHFLLFVPACAAGTYTIPMIPLGTFIQMCDNSTPALAKMAALTITIPTGSCCHSIPSNACIPDLTTAECNAQPAPRLFRVGQACPADGGPACAECAVASDCVDARGLCATYQCVANTCVRNNIPAYVPGGPSCCDPATGNSAPRADADVCTTDTCSADDAASLGTPNHAPNPGGACDDDNPCSFDDTCSAGGVCDGTDVAGTACATDADCQHGGDTPGATCVDLECDCALAPDLTLEVDNDANPNSCFAEGEKINVQVHVGPAANIITGGQFFITYDPSCLDFNSIVPGGDPYTLEIYENVDEVAGTIGYAVGIQLGGTGVAGDADLALISFTKIGECNTCNLCFTDVNPQHTYLTDDEGQPVLVVPSCSKDINATPDVDLNTPDDVKVKVGCNSASAVVTWPCVSASSSCGPLQISCTGSHLQTGTNFDGLAACGGTFPIGDTNFCCTATEPTCGASPEECWTVTVNDDTALDVEIQLSPTMDGGGNLVRCIEFEVFANCVQAPLVFCEDITFGGLFDLVGHFNGEVKIPSAVQPACITARDKLHTLRSCYTFDEDEDCVDGVLFAVFKQDPFFGGNWLIGGNLDGWKKENPNASHDVIDILDFGQLASQWLDPKDPNTPCPSTGCHGHTEGHADINGDGIVDMADFSFISMNFLEDSKDCCCPGSSSLGNTVGRTEISVRELFETGQGDLAVADLNADGMVNLADMAALMQGVRPTTKPADRGGKDGGTRSINRR